MSAMANMTNQNNSVMGKMFLSPQVDRTYPSGFATTTPVIDEEEEGRDEDIQVRMHYDRSSFGNHSGNHDNSAISDHDNISTSNVSVNREQTPRNRFIP